jgi:hypothetical protein
MKKNFFSSDEILLGKTDGFQYDHPFEIPINWKISE